MPTTQIVALPIQRFAGLWGTVIFKSPIQKEVENLKCPPYACEPLYIAMIRIMVRRLA